MASAKAITDHDEVRRWVEARGGHPARVKSTGRGKDPGVLRIDYPGYSGGDTLEAIEWDEFFEWFDRDGLAMLASPGKSRFSKFVKRAKGSAAKKSRSTAKKSASTAKKSPSASKKSASAAKKSASTARKSSSTSKKSASAATKSRPAASKSRSTSKKSASTASKSRSTAKKSPSTSKKSRSTAKTSSSSKTTTKHDTIRRWVEARGGYPARVKRTGRGSDPGVLRIDYPGYSGTTTLERIDWDEFFEWFERDGLAFLYQDKPRSRFSKLVSR